MAVRGQAFETMMLVISVIVALAILGVLTGIIGGLQIGIASSPDQAIHDQLKTIATSGYGYSVPTKAVIKKGTRLDIKSVIKNDQPALSAAKVVFCVDSTSLGITPTSDLPSAAGCTPASGSAALGGSTTMGPASKDIAFNFIVCGDANLNQGVYLISIAADPKTAGTNCVIPTT